MESSGALRQHLILRQHHSYSALCRTHSWRRAPLTLAILPSSWEAAGRHHASTSIPHKRSPPHCPESQCYEFQRSHADRLDRGGGWTPRWIPTAPRVPQRCRLRSGAPDIQGRPSLARPAWCHGLTIACCWSIVPFVSEFIWQALELPQCRVQSQSGLSARPATAGASVFRTHTKRCGVPKRTRPHPVEHRCTPGPQAEGYCPAPAGARSAANPVS